MTDRSDDTQASMGGPHGHIRIIQPSNKRQQRAEWDRSHAIRAMSQFEVWRGKGYLYTARESCLWTLNAEEAVGRMIDIAMVMASRAQQQQQQNHLLYGTWWSTGKIQGFFCNAPGKDIMRSSHQVHNEGDSVKQLTRSQEIRQGHEPCQGRREEEREGGMNNMARSTCKPFSFLPWSQ